MKQNIKSSRIFYLSKWKFQNELIIQQTCVKSCQGIIIYGLFNFIVGGVYPCEQLTHHCSLLGVEMGFTNMVVY
jgi:hypothetical protein